MNTLQEPEALERVLVAVFAHTRDLRGALDALQGAGIRKTSVTVVAGECPAPGPADDAGGEQAVPAHQALISGDLNDCVGAWGGMTLTAIAGIGLAVVAGAGKSVVAERLARALQDGPHNGSTSPSDADRAAYRAALQAGHWLLVIHSSPALFDEAERCARGSGAQRVDRFVA